MLEPDSRPADDNESRFFRWCWASLSAEQRNAMIVVAQTGAPNGRGVGHRVMTSLDQAGMTQLTTNLDDWFWTFTDLGKSVMWEGALLLKMELNGRNA